MAMVYIREVLGKGRGVLAGKEFAKGEIVERAPVIVVPGPQWEYLEKTALKDYTWGEGAIVVGFGMLYNHSDAPNVIVVCNIHPCHSHRKIQASYGWPSMERPLIF